jgi:dynein heavy chain
LQSYLPLFQILGNQDLKARHWKQIFDSLNYTKTHFDVSFNQLLSLDIVSKYNELEEVSNRASGEQLIEMQLENIQKIWANLNFSIVNYADYKNQYRISGVDEILTNIDDNLLSLQTMLGNKFVIQIKDQVYFWERKIQLIREILDEWLIFQRFWMSLENIFNFSDIQKQLPKET